MDSPIVGKLGLEPEQIGGKFLIGVLLDEGFQLLYWWDVVAFGFFAEEGLKIRHFMMHA